MHSRHHHGTHDIIDIDKVANDTPIAPNLDRFASERVFEKCRDDSLILPGELHRSIWICYAQDDVIELIEPMIQREIFLNSDLVDAIGRDGVRRRRFWNGYRLRNA